MSAFVYPAVTRVDEDGRVVVRFPDLPEAITDGHTRVEAYTEAADCLGTALAFRLRDKADIPPPSPQKRGQRMIPVPLWIAPKLALYSGMRAVGITNAELARRLNVRETVVRRMLDPDRHTRTEKLQAALAAIGKRLVLQLEDAG